MGPPTLQRLIDSPFMSLADDRKLLRGCLESVETDMSIADQWFDAFYDDLQKYILFTCRSKRIDDGQPSMEYLTFGVAVVTDGSLPDDILKESGGFVVAVQDVWGERNWIFKKVNGVRIIDEKNDVIEL